MAKKDIYRESRKEHRERVRNEGTAYRTRIVPNKKKYNRKRAKEEMHRAEGKT